MIFELKTEHHPELILKSFNDEMFRSFTFKQDSAILLHQEISGNTLQNRRCHIRKENSIPPLIKRLTGLKDVEFEISEEIDITDYTIPTIFEVSNNNFNLFCITGKRSIDLDEDGRTIVKYDITVNTKLGNICKYFIEKTYKQSQLDYFLMMKKFYIERNITVQV